MSKVPPVWDVDFTKLLSEFKVPGVDLDAVLQAQRKNIELFGRSVAHGEVLEMPKATHWLIQSNQQQVLEAIETFSLTLKDQ